MKKILVPCDFSYTAKQAYNFAVELAEKTEGEVFVLRVIDLPFSYESAYAAGHFSHEEKLLQQLQDVAQKNFESLRKVSRPYPNVHFSAVHGAVTDTIITFAENEKIDLIVMGTNGASGMKEYFVGSNTEKIVRYAPVPVISIRNLTGLKSITNIVFPTDVTSASKDLVAKVKELQQLFDAKLHLLLVSIDYKLVNSSMLLGKLEKFAKDNYLTNYTLNLQREDSAEAGIVEFAKEVGGDMIAMATHGRKGLAHLFSGSLAEDIVNHVHCPVWTYSIKNTSDESRKKDNANANAIFI